MGIHETSNSFCEPAPPHRPARTPLAPSPPAAVRVSAYQLEARSAITLPAPSGSNSAGRVSASQAWRWAGRLAFRNVRSPGPVLPYSATPKTISSRLRAVMLSGQVSASREEHASLGRRLGASRTPTAPFAFRCGRGCASGARPSERRLPPPRRRRSSPRGGQPDCAARRMHRRRGIASLPARSSPQNGP